MEHIKKYQIALIAMASMTPAMAFFVMPPDAHASTYSIGLSVSGDIKLNVSPAGNGANVVSDEIVVNSTCPYGYTLSIAGPTDTTLYKDGDGASSDKISPTAGTIQNPLEITGAGNLNTWGYSTTNNSADGKFIGLSNASNILLSKNTASANGGDSHKVYYGASVSIGTPIGTYQMKDPTTTGKITYQLVPDLDCTSYTVHYDPSSYFNDTLISGTGSMDDQRIFEDAATPLMTNGFTAPEGYYFAGWNTSPYGVDYTYAEEEQVTNLASVGGLITLYAMWTDCPANRICYFPNADDVIDTMADQTISATTQTTRLWASNFQRAYNGFAGWNTKPDGSGTNYGPNQMVTFAQGTYSSTKGGLSLYANWKSSIGLMQDWEDCARLNTGAVIALQDRRDADAYAIAKLADGKCWMIENLRFHTTASGHVVDSNTNNPASRFTALPRTTDPMQTPWCAVDNATCINQALLSTIDMTASQNGINSMQASDQSTYSYGVHYNWYTATAGQGTYSTMNTNAIGDICPFGWHLPTGGSASAEFNTLDIALGGTGQAVTDDDYAVIEPAERIKPWFDYPNNFVNSGNITSGYNPDHSVSDYYQYPLDLSYWSRTASDNTSAYTFSAYETYGENDVINVFNPGSEPRKKYTGVSVRCIKD